MQGNFTGNTQNGNGAWQRQAITSSNADLPNSDINLRTISQEKPQPSITEFSLKITHLKFH